MSARASGNTSPSKRLCAEQSSSRPCSALLSDEFAVEHYFCANKKGSVRCSCKNRMKAKIERRGTGERPHAVDTGGRATVVTDVSRRREIGISDKSWRRQHPVLRLHAKRSNSGRYTHSTADATGGPPLISRRRRCVRQPAET
eukprot:1178040-Pleurochrysis_carterae.AAC.1